MSLTPLLSLRQPAVLFAGQGSNWQLALSHAHYEGRLTSLLMSARALTGPVARQIASTVPGAFARLEELAQHLATSDTPPEPSELDAYPAVSVPGIVLGQIIALDQLKELGLDLDQVELVGHSQGSLGVVAARHPEHALAFALLLGTAASQEVGSSDHRPRMLSVRGVDRAVVEKHAAGAELAVTNGPRHFVLTGTPEQLAAAQREISAAVDEANSSLAARERGGDEITPRFDELPVAGFFHHSAMQAAADRAAAWAKECGLDLGDTTPQELADAILVQPHDWPNEVASLRAKGVTEVLSLDRSLSTITAKLLAGSGIAIVPATTPAERDLLGTPGATLPTAADYSDFAPRLITLPTGETVTQTRFSTLTGLSPVMLGGMTPTTVDPGIVAAAANAGFWAEMGGGGQYSEEVFNRNKDGLVEQLEPGRSAQFNSMFFDRYMWNLQFGVTRIVSKARAAGAAINGVTVSAGIPEVEEATELIAQLHDDGFPYVSFKPGTSKQIRDALAIADANPNTDIIIQVEDGHSGGHHSWVDLGDMLVDTYAEVRQRPNAYLAVGGGIHSPERATEYLTGSWAHGYGLPSMPVDAVILGTVAMATKEATTTPQVKQLLVNTPGISPDDNKGWVGRLQCAGGVTSGQSHLLADMHEVDNDFAAASRLITSLDIEEYAEHRDELIAALNKTSKPYFGDVDTMTYAQWLQRFVDLAFPWKDPTWPDRFLDLLHRVEARLHPVDHGEIPTLFDSIDDCEDAQGCVDKLVAAYPQAVELTVTPRDAAWFVGLNRKHHKPMPWVTAIDGDLKTWFGLDSLWQAQDERYPAEAVRVIPGPVSVAGIKRVDEPVAELLARFEADCTTSLIDAAVTPTARFSRLAEAADAAEFLRAAPTIQWHGHLIDNPAHVLPDSATELVDTDEGWVIRVHSDSYWDELPAEQRPFYVEHVDIPLDLPSSTATGASPVVSDERLPKAVFDLLAGVAGVGSTSETGDEITDLPVADADGTIHYSFTLPASLLPAHSAVSGAALGSVAAGTPDALVGPCWPAIYAALGTGRLADGYPVIEGLLNAVHLDHVIDLRVPLEELADGRRIDVESRCASIAESASGRIVTVELTLYSEGEIVATQMQRFAIRGRANGTDMPVPAPEWGGGKSATKVEATARSFVDRAIVHAPSDMTPFALVSGDYNPIHTSTNAAGLVGLEAPLVHGMWLSATAQHLAGRHGRVVGWTYSMFGMVQLDDAVEITVERVGRKGIHRALEVTCRIDGEVVSRGQALLAQPRTAYVYPGQGIQAAGMGRGDRDSSPAAREVWRRADQHTRATLGFSIRHIVDDNPTVLNVRGTTFRHPKGVLNLTQFTQVALAVVAYAQTERLRENNAIGSDAMYAGHSLGEYTALASLANIFALEDVIDIVYSRGSAMHGLVPRDEAGRSNYGMGALRPNMIGVAAEDVEDYLAGVAAETGEYLEIVNYNIAGQQYSIAGTIKGLAALSEHANSITPRAYVTVPGIDVPFHSRVLRPGVPAFAAKLDELLPTTVDLDALIGRYVPNLVARPFELTQSFVDSILEVVPSERLQGIDVAIADEQTLARDLLIELLSWQFASPVRWIETQALLISEVEQIIEVGLAASPTLTNLASRTMDILGSHRPVFNVERDQDAVMLNDVQQPPAVEEVAEETVETAPVESAPEQAAAAPAPASVASGGSAQDAPDLPFSAGEAIMVLFAFQNKIRPDQINGSDTVEELTNGVSSRRNQLLMDMSAELGVPAIDGAADADVTTLRERVRTAAPGYAPFGTVLGEAVTARLRQLTGASGYKPAHVAERVTGTWGLPAGWVGHVEAEILLGSREGDSVRGGSLSTIPTSASSKAEVDALIDAAVQAVAATHGVSVSLSAGGSGGGAGSVVDSAALNAYADSVTGPEGILAALARTTLNQLGIIDEVAEVAVSDTTLLDTVEAELGAGWLKTVTPTFDATRAVLFDDRWASAREDLARVALGELALTPARFAGTGEVIAEQATWWAANGGADPALLREIARAAVDKPEQRYLGEVALVTGAAPGSIAAALVEGLLAGGATVIMTASNVSQARKEFARQLFARHASVDAALWLVPANLSSYRDVDALIEWIGNEQRESVGNEVKILKPALTPTLAFPFAAPSVSGSLADAGAAAENQTRLLLWSLERTIAGLSQLAQNDPGFPDTRCHVVLPGSPNRGMFGGDGAYGEVKAALDAILAKWSAEAGWPEGVTLAQAKIGWVSGTSLMGGNDVLVPAAEKAGIHVWSPEEISSELLDLASPEAKQQAAQAPIEADLTGGLGSSAVSMSALAEAARADAESAVLGTDAEADTTINALPNAAHPTQPGEVTVGEVTRDLDDMIVMVGLGEVSSWGSGRTRAQAEYGIQRDGSVDLTAAGVLELAWMTGLISWAEDPRPGWYDASGAEVPEDEVYERFRDEVVARSGIRRLSDKYFLTDGGSIDVTEVFLDKDITFTVPSEAEARDIETADPDKTRVALIDGEWTVTRVKGATARVPRKATLTRSVAGQMPEGFDPARWGIPASMIEGLDRIAVWNLVTAIDAFISAGFTPAELLRAVHPGDVASTQGTGIGGMESLHKVFVSRFLGQERPSDILQEALPNVVAAHVMQSLVGGYGSMIHPVAACATAAVSIEEGVDKIALGKADFVVAGGIDDVQVESLTGFGDMNATAETAAMTAKGISDRFISRANDRRRGGFLEAEGGGTVLLARASVAAELGLPVLAVVAHAASYGDGAHTSIPAPGLGALGAARGRENSRLARSLRSLGLTPDDVRVVSKHDTSTNANDPNESELHSRLWEAVGRTEGNPLFVVSQKSLTGHAKAGAALFQMGGLVDILRTGSLPANAALDCVDPLIAPKARPLVWLRSPLALGEGAVKAGVLTSLGFGHVGAVVVLAHPAVFEAALARSGGDVAAWREHATTRLRAGAQHFEAGMIGRAELFTQVEGRRLPTVGEHEAEIALLLDENARLGEDGVYPRV
ncbi:Erythronolide synthase, modules 1 and 2 [Corynebacterium atrinae]|uniref:type I polyketide synthase n=1 Tax=Corynebacterium atrinae TaxID=1336740 RepID=UPI0025B5E5F7|nr:type I polyketide synthase [Corynebacterium atrinae]WJY62412.1 Erythronolide synthase, modules 1 and 2 [Corynebacterium atrinae]